MFEERPRPRRKIPLRTLILMVVALIAFGRYFWVTQPRRAPGPKGNGPMIIDVVPRTPRAEPPGPGPDGDAGTL